MVLSQYRAKLNASIQQYRLYQKVSSRAIVAICLLCLIGQFALWPQIISSKGGTERYVRETTDFSPTLTAARILRLGQGTQLYDRTTQRAVQQSIVAPFATLRSDYLLIYIHPPLEALLIMPLLDLPYTAVFWLWTLCSYLAYIGALALLQATLPLPRRALPIASLVALSYHPLHLSLWVGQNTALVVLGFCGVLAGVRLNNALLTGTALLMIALKPQLMPLVCIFLFIGRYYRALGVAGILGAIGVVCTMPILGWRWPLAYLRFLAIDSNLGAAVAEKPYIMPNWRGFATNLIKADAPQTVTLLTLLLTALTLVIFMWIILRINRQERAVWKRRTEPWGQATTTFAFGWAGILALLIAPHLNPHDLAVLIVPAWILVHYWFAQTRQKADRKFGPILLGIGYLLPLATLYATQDYRLPVISLVSFMVVLAGYLALLVLEQQRAKITHHDAAYISGILINEQAQAGPPGPA